MLHESPGIVHHGFDVAGALQTVAQRRRQRVRQRPVRGAHKHQLALPETQGVPDGRGRGAQRQRARRRRHIQPDEHPGLGVGQQPHHTIAPRVHENVTSVLYDEIRRAVHERFRRHLRDGPRHRRERPHPGDSRSIGHAPDDFGRRDGTGQRDGHKAVPEFGMQHNPGLQLAAQRTHACRQGILEAFRQGRHRRHPQIRLPDHELKPVLAVTRGAAFPVSAVRIKMNPFHSPAHPLLLVRLILKKCVRKVDFRPPGITFSLFPTRPYRRTSCQSIS